VSVRVSPEISYVNVEKTEYIDALVHRQIDKLHRFADDIMSCKVAIEQPNQHQRSGNPYRVRVELTLPPGKHLVVSKGLGDHEMHDELGTVVRSAFDAMERRLRAIDERRKGEVKQHEEPIAFVSALHPEDGYAFVRTPEGRELYLHENSLLDGDFSRIGVGTGVWFAEEMGQEGPQISSARIVSQPPGR
jgi:ribosomal subunit interface protein